MPYHNHHLTYNTKTCIAMLKPETTAKGNFVYASLLKQQGNSDFDFISVSFLPLYTLSTYSFVKIVWFEDRIVIFLWQFLLKNHFNERKIHSGLFLSYAITVIDVNDIISIIGYPRSLLKYHFTSILAAF